MNPMRWMLAAAAVVAAASAWLLLGEEAARPATPGATVAPDAPTRRIEVDLPLAAPASADAPDGSARDAQAARPAGSAPRALGPAATLQALGPVRRVSGLVRRMSDGSPVAGAQVLPAAAPDDQAALRATGHAPMPGVGLGDHVGFVRNVPGRPPSRWSTDGQGWFEVDTVSVHAPALLFLLPEAPRPAPAALFELPPGPGPVEGISVRLPTGWALTGTITDEQHRPVAGALVTVGAPSRPADLGEALSAEPHQRGRKPHGIAESDGTGRFLLRDLAVADGVDEVTVGVLADGFVHSATDMLVPRDHVLVGPADVALHRAGAIAGRVTDGLGAPRPRAVVRVEWTQTERHVDSVPAPEGGLSAVTGSDGRYVVDHVPAGRHLVSARPAERPFSLWRQDVAVSAGDTTVLDFAVEAGADVIGRVTDETGNVVAGLAVELVRVVEWDSPGASGVLVSSMGGPDGEWVEARTVEGDAGGPGRTELSTREGLAETDARGEYRFEGVLSGTKRLRGPADVGRRLLPPEHEFVVERSERLGPFDFVQGLGRSVRGRVTDVHGAPIAEARVAVQPEGTSVWNDSDAVRTDDHGRFEVAGLSSEPMTLWVSKAGFVNLWETVTPGPAFHDLVLDPALTLQGVVLEAATGEPVRRFTIVISSGHTKLSMTQQDEQGGFAVSVDDDELRTVTIRATGFAEAVVERVRPTGTALAPLRVLLQPDGSD